MVLSSVVTAMIFRPSEVAMRWDTVGGLESSTLGFLLSPFRLSATISTDSSDSSRDTVE